MRIPLLALVAAIATAADPVELPVTRVTLSTSGVGAFEHRGTVDGDAETMLRFRSAQIDDVLKSMVLQDLGGGAGAIVRYPSQEPLERTLGSFRIDLSSDPSLPGILTQLRGQAVTVEHLDRTVDGTVIGVEDRTIYRHGTEMQTEWILNLLVDGQLRALPVADLRGVRPRDARVRADLEQALTALDGALDQERRPVVAAFRGAGKREVRVAYVVEAPVWKAAYRLLLPTDGGPATLQGWAIIENATQSDWRGVQLSLMGGRPVAFTMDLHRSHYVRRPRVDLDLGPNVVVPDPAEGGERDKAVARAEEAGQTFGGEQAGVQLLPPIEENTPDPAGSLASALAVATSGTADLGALVRYDIGAVTLARGGAAMLPILSATVALERVALWNRMVHPRLPLAAVRFVHPGPQLAPGPLTVYDGTSYAGDARFASIGPGATVTAGYAVEQRITVDVEEPDEDEQTDLVRIVNGVLEQRSIRERRLVYRATNVGTSAQTLIIEHPFAPGYEQRGGPLPEERVGTVDRHRLSIPAGRNAALEIREIRTESTTLALTTPDAEFILHLQGMAASPALRAAIARLGTLRAACDEAERDAARVRARSQELGKEQERLRENLKAVPTESAFAGTLLAKLGRLEIEIGALQQEADRQDGLWTERRRTLESELAALTVE